MKDYNKFAHIYKTHTTTSDFAEIAQLIHNAKSLIFTAGAGMGVDSGLPDFRGNNGFWKAYPMLQGKGFGEMANPQHFEENPRVGWGFYGHRLNLYRSTTPHGGFGILRKWASEKKDNYFIYTSNVDGAFQKAGFCSRKVLECHGSIHHLQGLESRYDRRTKGQIISADGFELTIDENLHAQGELPRDEKGNLLRPNILMFGDWGWDSSRTDQQYRRMDNWLDGVSLRDTVIIEVGAGTSIPSVRRTSEEFQRAGATLVRINPRESHGGDFCLPMGGLEGLQKIDEVYSA